MVSGLRFMGGVGGHPNCRVTGDRAIEGCRHSSIDCFVNGLGRPSLQSVSIFEGVQIMRNALDAVNQTVPLLVRLPHVQVLVTRHLDRDVRDVYRQIPINSLLLRTKPPCKWDAGQCIRPFSEKGDN